MAKPETLRVDFLVERRGAQFFFRNTTHESHIWHGPFADATDVAEHVGHYMTEQLLEEFEFERLP